MVLPDGVASLVASLIVKGLTIAASFGIVDSVAHTCTVPLPSSKLIVVARDTITTAKEREIKY